MKAGTWNFGAGSIINGKPVEDMTDAEKQAFINQMAAKGRSVIIEGFNDGGSKEMKESKGGDMIVNNNTIVQKKDEFDYWTLLEHRYAGMAMQSYISDNVYLREIRGMCKDPQEMRDLIADLSILLATTLVQKLKEKEERK